MGHISGIVTRPTITDANTPGLWDRVWEQPVALDKDLYRVRKQERAIRWRRIEALVRDTFGGFDGLAVVEIGAGTGTHAALMAARGARVAVLDYSEEALARARRLFGSLNLSAEFIRADALALDDGLRGRFDLAMSFGLAEHFLDEARRRIVGAHFELVRSGGLALVSVPNRANPPYRLHKWVAERTGAWAVGEEYPFSRSELEAMAREWDLAEQGFFGDSLWSSKKFLNPLKWFPRRRKKRPAGEGGAGGGSPGSPRPFRRRLPRPERGSPWDDRYSYALVFWGRKR